jgi:hypothetical protein
MVYYTVYMVILFFLKLIVEIWIMRSFASSLSCDSSL